ncbi:MAG: TM2 domain-containing protein [bacterium]
MSGETPAPTPVSAPTPAPAAAPGQKDWLITLLLSIFLGTLGVDRFYLGYIGLGILKLAITIVSCGLAGWIWWIIDIVFIATDKMTDATGQKLYKK